MKRVWIRAREKEKLTRDDFPGAVDGGAHGELDEFHQDLAYRVAASHVGHGGGHSDKLFLRSESLGVLTGVALNFA